MASRLRVFCGPNGSGKSTLFHTISKKFSLGTFVNADEIEVKLRAENGFAFSEFGIESQDRTIKQLLLKSQIAKAHLAGKRVEIENGIIRCEEHHVDSYLAAAIADVVRTLLLTSRESFSFETVFSHRSKLNFVKKAKRAGYRTYAYFIATESPEINISRIAVRVESGGHSVPQDKLRDRYYRSLALLKSIASTVDRCFVFDNSRSDEQRLVVELEQGRVRWLDAGPVPQWLRKHLPGVRPD